MNVKAGWKNLGISYLTTFHLLACFLVCYSPSANAGNPKAELRTRLLLSNIRSHLAKQVDEVVQQKECDSGLILCEAPKEKEASPEESDEIPPAPKIRGHHKPQMKVNPKDIIQTMMHKVHKVHKKLEIDHEKIKTHKKDKSDEEDGDDNENVSKNETDEKGDDEDDDEVSEGEVPKKEKVVKPAKEVTKKEKTSKKESSKKTKIKKVAAEEEEGIRFPRDIPVFAATSSAVASEQCRRHSRLFLRQLERYKMWALLMFDASAKLPSGILQGNINQFGDFDECLTVNAVLKDKSQRKDNDITQGIQGKYCLANLDIEATANEGALEQAVSRAESYGFIRSTAEDIGYFIPRFTTINWGVCVPSSCSAKDVEKALADELSVYNDTAGVSFTVLIQKEACVDRDDLNFSIGLGNILTLVFYSSIIAMSGFATYRDLRSETTPEQNTEEEVIDESSEKPEDDKDEALGKEGTPKQGKLYQILMAFSWKKSIGDLLSSGADDDISCVHGIKALFTVILYVAHKTVPLALTPYYNRIQLTKLTNSAASTILRTSIIYTDSFLLVSGVLTSYNLTQEVLTKGRLSWFRRLITRFIRLTPPLLAVTLFYGYVSEELGSGPLWGPIVGKNAEICRENSWTNLLYIQNFFDFQEMCAPQTHQLALDMQLSLSAPLLVYILFHYDLLGLLILQFIYLLSSALRYIATSNNNLTLVFYHGVTVSQLYDTANYLYTQAIYRATPYVLGVTIGYYLKKKGNDFTGCVQKPLIAIGWILATCLGFLSIVTPAHLADRAYEYNAQEAAQYAALSPISWSLALGWLIAACHLGYGGWLNNFLSNKFLLILSRLSYSIYLVQFLVFNHNVGILRTAKVFSVTDALDITEMATVLCLAFVLTMLFDIPMKEIKTIILTRSTPPTSPEGGEDEQEGERGELQPENTEKDPEENNKNSLEESKDVNIGNDQNIDDNYLEEDEYEDDEEEQNEEEEEAGGPLRRTSRIQFDDELETPIRRSSRLQFDDDDGIPGPLRRAGRINFGDEEEESPLRRTSRIQFDDEEKDFWVDDRPEEPLDDKEIDDFWGRNED